MGVKSDTYLQSTTSRVTKRDFSGTIKMYCSPTSRP